MSELNPYYWSERYKNNQTGWDLGHVSPPLKAYIDQLKNKDLKILIPGCGRGFEGVYLRENGFKNVFLVDYSKAALDEVKKTSPDFPNENLICSDFFEIKGQFDLIIEQTLFCALDPSLRSKYVEKMNELLTPEGKLVGLLFNQDFEGGPPFGGSQTEYEAIFSKELQIETMVDCYNSIEPRLGHELFFIAKKKRKI